MFLSAGVQGRTWTNRKGKTLEADLVRVRGDTVYLEMNGKIKPLKISLLCDADQEFIKQYEKEQAEKKKAEEFAKRKAKRRAKWLDDYDDVKAEAEEFGLPIFLLYTAPEWCGYCVELESNILNKSDFKKYANANLVLFIADFSSSGTADDWKEDYPQLAKDFPCSGYPRAYLISTGGKKLGSIGGYDSEWSVQDYIDKLENFKGR